MASLNGSVLGHRLLEEAVERSFLIAAQRAFPVGGGFRPAAYKEEGDGQEQERKWPYPQHDRLHFKPRLEEYELTVAADDEAHDLIVGIAGSEPLADEEAEVAGERRSRIIDRLVLADKAAQARRQCPRACLKRRVLEYLVGFNGYRRCRNGKEKQGCNDEAAHALFRRLNS